MFAHAKARQTNLNEANRAAGGSWVLGPTAPVRAGIGDRRFVGCRAATHVKRSHEGKSFRDRCKSICTTLPVKVVQLADALERVA